MANGGGKDSMRNRRIENKNCLICGKEFMARVDHLKVGKGKYCHDCCHKPGGKVMRSLYPILPAFNSHLAYKARKIAKVLPKKPCEVCNLQDADKHHDDYSKPLKINWLCRKHHIQKHLSFK